MKRAVVLLLPLLMLMALNEVARAQGGGHTLFGDLKVDESRADKLAPITFHIILYSESGAVVSRQAVASNGRYRFMNLDNGRYVLVVEVDNKEVARVPVMINEIRKTDIQHDIALEWRAQPGAGDAGKTGTVSVADSYTRKPSSHALFAKAQEAMKKGDNDQAISFLQQVVNADPKDFIAWTELGTVYFRKGDAGDSEKAYLRALEEKPTFFPALLNLGKVRIAGKNFDGAIEVFTLAVKEQPQSADANFWLGESYLQIKKGSKAVGYLNEAIRLDPVGKAEAHLRLALLYHGAGLKDRAASEYEQFLAKKPDYPDKKRLQQYISENKKQ